MLYHKKNYLPYAALACSLLVTEHAYSAERTIQPNFSLRTFYNDNVRVRSEDFADEITGIAAKVSANVLRKTERSNLALYLQNDSSLHSEDSYDSHDQLLSLNYLQAYERAQIGVSSQYVRDTSRTSEIENTGEIGNVRRELYSVMFNASTDLTEKTSMLGELSLSKSEYDENNDGLVGYDSQSALLKFSYRYSEKLAFNVFPSISRYTSGERRAFARFASFISGIGYVDRGQFLPLGYKNESSSYGFSIGADYQHSEKNSSSFSIGRTQRVSEYDLSKETDVICSSVSTSIVLLSANAICENEKSKTNITNFNYNTVWQLELSRLAVGASLEFVPTSTGSLSKTKRFDVKYQYKLSEKLNVDSNIALSEIDTERRVNINTNSSFQRRFLNTSLGLNYRINRQLSTKVNYSFYRVYDDAFTDSRKRNYVSFSMSYSPTKIFW